MKNQKRFVISGMFKRYTILGACVMLVALFASAAQAETVMVDPGPASKAYDPVNGTPGEINYAQDFIIDNQTNTGQVDVLFTDNKMLLWEGGYGPQTIALSGPDGCGDVTVQLINTDNQVVAQSYGKFAPCDSGEIILQLFADHNIVNIRLISDAPGFTADGSYEWTWDTSGRIPQVWELGGNKAPLADPGGPYRGNPNEPVEFDGSGSSDPDGSIADPGGYSWDFGDDETATGSRPTHSYAEAGTYNVCLAVTDDDDVTSSFCTTSEIGLLADAGGPYVADANGIIEYDGRGSIGQIDYLLWDFGDGGQSDVSFGSYTYDNTAGHEYHVTLTVTEVTDTGDKTNVDTTTATVAGAQSNSPPIPDAGEPVTGVVGAVVTFDGSGSTDHDGEIVQYDWNFGDGNFAQNGGPTPTNTYDSPGTYSVKLTVYDDKYSRVDDFTTAEIFADNLPPVADANGPYTGEAGAPVAFDSTGSEDQDGEITSFEWDFGDGWTDVGDTVSHAYAEAGEYDVVLTVIDTSGAIAEDKTTATIGTDNLPPVADAKGPYNGIVGAPVSFNGADSDDEDGEITSFEWDFSDGDKSYAEQPKHTFLAPGDYDVTLTVTDNDGVYDVDVTKAIIAEGNILPVADVGGPYRGQIGVPVNFDGSASYDDDGTIDTYEWDFGDSTNGGSETMDHVYNAAGFYRVNLTVTDNDGATVADSIMVRIGTASVPPLADAGGSYTGVPGAAIDFDGRGSSGLDDSITTWAWDFGDNTENTGATPTKTYNASGTYIVTLTVTDASGETDIDVTTALIGQGSLPPVADAGDGYPGASGAPVIFDGTGSIDRDGGTIDTYAWDFGDPNDSTPGSGATPSHTYSEGGFYLVTLTVTNSDGKKDSDTTLAAIGSEDTISPSPLYRFWSDQNFTHFYTISEAEKDATIENYPDEVWRYETIAYYAFPPGLEPVAVASMPVYRFWSDQNQAHFFTISEAEKDNILATYPEEVWRYETIAYYAYPPGSEPVGSMPVYRFWSDTYFTHFYTISEAEKDDIIANYPEEIWRYETIAWYAYTTAAPQ